MLPIPMLLAVLFMKRHRANEAAIGVLMAAVLSAVVLAATSTFLWA